MYINFTKEFLLANLCPEDSVIPDFFIKTGIDLWNKGLSDYETKFDFDGMRIASNCIFSNIIQNSTDYKEDFMETLYKKS